MNPPSDPDIGTNTKSRQATAVMIFSVLFFGPVALSPMKASPAVTPAINLELEKEVTKISKSIRALARVNPEKSKSIAKAIHSASKNYQVDSKLMVAILMQESTFRQNVSSGTGDFSISQINVKTWNKEFLRLKREPLDIERLKTDKIYAIHRMAEILSILQDRHSDDEDWFATYHSRNPVNKDIYKEKIAFHLSKIKHIQ